MMSPLNQMQRTQKAIAKSLQRLSSGSRVNSAKDDSASLSILNKLDAQSRGLVMANQNINQAQGMLQTAASAIDTQLELVQKMRELSLRSSSGTLTSQDRVNLDKEFQALYAEYQRITESTEFNGVRLLDGSFSNSTIYVGDGRNAKGDNTIDFSLPSLTSSDIFKSTVGNGTFTQSQTLDTTDTYPLLVESESYSYDSRLADFNNDGDLDIVSADNNSSTISVRMGNGDGTFQTVRTYSVSAGAYSVTVGDFNNDGFDDIATSSDSTNVASVFLNDGSGGFAAAATFSLESVGNKIVAGDFDGNGRDDLAVLEIGNSKIELFLSSAAGVFTTASTSKTTSSNVADIAIGDVSGSNSLDIVAVNGEDYTYQVFEGNGAGGLTTQLAIDTNYAFNKVALADITNDGNDDFIFTSYNDGAISTIVSGVGVENDSLDGSLLTSFLITDLNGDNIVDFVGADEGRVYFIEGDNSGIFTGLSVAGGNSQTNYSLAAGDLDGDNVSDIVGSQGDFDSLYIGMGYSGGAFTTEDTSSTFQSATSTVTQGPGTFEVKLGDLNSDGILDIVSANYIASTISVFLGKADGTYFNQMTYAVGANITDLLLEDLNGDGKLDIATADYGDSTVSILTNKGNGLFNTRTTFATSSGAYQIRSAEINGDGNLDLVTSNGSEIDYHLNNGVGTFGAGTIAVIEAWTGSIKDFQTGDINNDGKADIVYSWQRNLSNNIKIRTGNGNGTFTAQANLTSGLSPRGVVLGDFNHDGNLDIANVNFGTTTLSVYLGAGTGSFGASVTYTIASGAEDIYTADLNGDGNLDLVVGNSNNSALNILMGNSNGTFNTQTTFSISGGTSLKAYGLALGDTNGDGSIDIVTANYTDSISIITNGTQQIPATASSMSIISQSASEAALNILDAALGNLRSAQASIGALHERLDFAASFNMLTHESLEDAKSKMNDVDLALETSELVRSQILAQAQIAVLAQANLQAKIVLNLLQFK